MTTTRPLFFIIPMLIAALIAGLLQGGMSAPSAFGQAEPITAPLPQTITVVGKGTVSGEPNLAVSNIGVEASGADVMTTSADVEQTMTAILDALVAAGVAEADIQTIGYSVFSEPNYDPAGEMLDGTNYRVVNSLRVVIRNLDEIGAVLDAAIAAGANNIFGVNFGIDDPADLESDARAKAIDNARAKALEIAELSNLTLGNVVSVSEVIGNSGGFYNSTALTAQDTIGGGGPIVEGELDVTVQLQVVYAAQPGRNDGTATLPPPPQQSASPSDNTTAGQADDQETTQPDAPISDEDSTQDIDGEDEQPVTDEDGPNIGDSDGEPSDSDDPLVNATLAPIGSVEILTNSDPLTANVQGDLPDGCTTIAQSQVTQNNRTFEIVLMMQRPVDAMCTQALVPYEELVSLDVSPADLDPNEEYTVVVNGEVTTRFTIDG